MTPIFRRDSSYQSSEAGSELDDYYEKQPQPEHEHEHELEHEYELEHPFQLRPGHSRTISGDEHEIIDEHGRSHLVPQLQMPDHSILAKRTMEPSPDDEHDMDRDSFYDLYESETPTHHEHEHEHEHQHEHQHGRRRRDSDIPDLPMHDVSLE